jgi:hypothetical protein
MEAKDAEVLQLVRRNAVLQVRGRSPVWEGGCGGGVRSWTGSRRGCARAPLACARARLSEWHLFIRCSRRGLGTLPTDDPVPNACSTQRDHLCTPNSLSPSSGRCQPHPHPQHPTRPPVEPLLPSTRRGTAAASATQRHMSDAVPLAAPQPTLRRLMTAGGRGGRTARPGGGPGGRGGGACRCRRGACASGRSGPADGGAGQARGAARRRGPTPCEWRCRFIDAHALLVLFLHCPYWRCCLYGE